MGHLNISHGSLEYQSWVTSISVMGHFNISHGSVQYQQGFSLTFEVEGHWLVSRQVPCKTEGRRPKSLGGSGGMLPRKNFRT